jgi:hypothetical protein
MNGRSILARCGRYGVCGIPMSGAVSPPLTLILLQGPYPIVPSKSHIRTISSAVVTAQTANVTAKTMSLRIIIPGMVAGRAGRSLG